MEPHDKTEKGVRFGCGFVFGLIVGAVSAVRFFHSDGNSFMIMTIATAITFAFAAVRFGDSLWRWLKDVWIWWV